MNPVKLAELKGSGVVEGEGEREGDGDAWKQWILSDVAAAPYEGDVYWVNYRTGEADW